MAHSFCLTWDRRVSVFMTVLYCNFVHLLDDDRSFLWPSQLVAPLAAESVIGDLIP
jgi:hypothetical protein